MELEFLPREESVEDVRHAFKDELDISNFDQLVPNPAITYPFALDPFQKRAIVRLEEHQNVMVVAHTSAGKTVVAEYAIALSRKCGTKVVYTSPLKALSNQKFRDFKELFGDVGIVTGDVVLNSDAFCLIMTTEVLRSMLYNNSPGLRDVEWVILDEIHYINDSERGVVWEEVLILLPPSIKVIMLSATVPNYIEFAEWVGAIRNQTVYVEYTIHRPTPLEHSIYTKGYLIKIMESNSKQTDFSEYDKVIKQFMNAQPERPRFSKKMKQPSKIDLKRQAVSEDMRYRSLIMTLREANKLPAVVFAFSRPKCDSRADKLVDPGDTLLSPTEAAYVSNFVEKALNRIDEIDRDLPQINFVRNLIQQGVGVHHSGILPILKEIVEILFSEGVLKVLVATETFSVGLNMPTKTVVFCGIKKFDGNTWRNMSPAEYTQMSGRAGRRGKDDKGHVILFIKDPTQAPEPTVLRQIIRKRPLNLESQFRVTYNMIANQIKAAESDIKAIVQKSFKQKDIITGTSKARQKALTAELNLVDQNLISFCSDVIQVITNKIPLPMVPCLALAVSQDSVALPFLILDWEYSGIMFNPDTSVMKPETCTHIIAFFNLRSIPRLDVDVANLTPFTFRQLKRIWKSGQSVGYFGEIDQY